MLTTYKQFRKLSESVEGLSSQKVFNTKVRESLRESDLINFLKATSGLTWTMPSRGHHVGKADGGEFVSFVLERIETAKKNGKPLKREEIEYRYLAKDFTYGEGGRVLKQGYGEIDLYRNTGEQNLPAVISAWKNICSRLQAAGLTTANKTAIFATTEN